MSWLALKIWCAAWLIQKSRCKQQKDGKPYRFQKSELYAYFKKVGQKECKDALQELDAANLLRIADTEIWFASSLDDIKNAQVRTRATAMFARLHENNRDKRMKFPKRLLRLIIRCGQQVVRVATMLGLLLRIMLVKRYNDYRGCVKAEWIATLFGVSRHRVNTERAKLINEGIFRRLPTPQWVKNTYGEWVALNLGETEPTAPGENSAEEPPKVEPPAPENLPNLGAPDLHQIPSSFGEVVRNQEITPGAPPREGKTGALQLPILTQPTWNNITLEDLRDDARSERLREEAIQRGHLKDTQPDQLNFFAGIAHALRVAKSNACGLLRTIVEKGLWHVMSQADESHGIVRLQRSSEDQETQHAAQVCKAFFTMAPAEEETQVQEQPIALSEDARTFQAYTKTFEHARITDGTLQSMQEHGYLQDWTQERWENAEIELAHARLVRARQQYQAMDTTGMQDMMGEDIYEDDEQHGDWD